MLLYNIVVLTCDVGLLCNRAHLGKILVIRYVFYTACEMFVSTCRLFELCHEQEKILSRYLHIITNFTVMLKASIKYSR